MFYRIAFKWLSITVIVLVAFLVILLFLGYLLKENEATTTKLKAQLEQEAYQQQETQQRRKNLFYPLPSALNSFEKSQQKIIADNLSCQTDAQCFLVHTHSRALGCIVSVNATGAAILLKTSSNNESLILSNDYCRQEYAKKRNLSAQCRNNYCDF